MFVAVNAIHLWWKGLTKGTLINNPDRKKEEVMENVEKLFNG